MSKKASCTGGPCLLNPLELPIVCQQCPRFDRGLLRKLKNESSPIDDIVREPQTCPICGNVFFDRQNKTYCSAPCCKRAYRLRKLARTTEDKLKAYEYRECVICHTWYYPHTDQQKTCGGKCSVEYMKRTYKRGVNTGSKKLARLQYQDDDMKNTIIHNPVFTVQFKRLHKLDTLPLDDLDYYIKFLSANHPWWKSLSQPRQGAILNIAYSFGVSAFTSSFRAPLLAMRMCRWSDAKSGILSSAWARENGVRAVEIARQIESGEWQRDPLEQIAEEEEKLEQGSLV